MDKSERQAYYHQKQKQNRKNAGKTRGKPTKARQVHSGLDSATMEAQRLGFRVKI